MTGVLTHSPEAVVAQLIIDLGLGVAPPGQYDWTIYYSNEPDQPGNCITVYGTQGILEGRHQINGESQERNGVQVRVRGLDHDTAQAKANAIAIAIDQQVYQNIVTVDSTDYLVHAMNRTTDVLFLGYGVDNSERPVFTINATVVLHLQS